MNQVLSRAWHHPRLPAREMIHPLPETCVEPGSVKKETISTEANTRKEVGKKRWKIRNSEGPRWQMQMRLGDLHCDRLLCTPQRQARSKGFRLNAAHAETKNKGRNKSCVNTKKRKDTQGKHVLRGRREEKVRGRWGWGWGGAIKVE